MTLVSVVVPCFNQADTLGETLDSVLAQTYDEWECIVVDDGSTDPAVGSIIVVYKETDERVHGVRVTNRGLPGARNTGLMLARGEAMLPIDSDDWLREDYLEKTVPLLAGADVVLTGLQEHGEHRNGRYDPGYDRPLGEVTLEALWQQNLLFYSALFRTDLLREVGGYNGRMVRGWEDYDLWLDLFTRGVRFAEIREPLLNYRTKADSMLQDTERNWRAWNYEEMRRHHV